LGEVRTAGGSSHFACEGYDLNGKALMEDCGGTIYVQLSNELHHSVGMQQEGETFAETRRRMWFKGAVTAGRGG
jgi:hypothetical protein